MSLLTAGANSLPDIFKAIERTTLDIARVLGVDVMMLGGGSGSYALAKEKASQLSMTG